ncbi:MAG: hypothetical protein O7C67_12990, partial [Gammaproteobacteria bacterium]|nr:hypothetical protein [Gammaproteobacteria bacterium]
MRLTASGRRHGESEFEAVLRNYRQRSVKGRFAILVCALGLTSCAGQAQLELIYNKSASYHAPDRNPIVVIPGLMGSSLRDRLNGAMVWGAFGGKSVNPANPEGARLLALPLDESQDAVEPTGVLDRIKIRLVGIPLQLKVYAQLLSTLGAAGYRDSDL